MGTGTAEPMTLTDRLRDLLAQEHGGMVGEFGDCKGAPKCDTCQVLLDADPGQAERNIIYKMGWAIHKAMRDAPDAHAAVAALSKDEWQRVLRSAWPVLRQHLELFSGLPPVGGA